MHGPSHSFGSLSNDAATARARNKRRRNAVQYYWLNRDKILAKRRAAYDRLNEEIRLAAKKRERDAAKAEERRVKRQEYYKRNRTKIIASSLAWYQRNKERVAAYQRSPEWRARHLAAANRWAARNRQQVRNYGAKYRRENARELAVKRCEFRCKNRAQLRERAKQRRDAKDDSYFHLLGATDTVRRAVLASSR